MFLNMNDERKSDSEVGWGSQCNYLQGDTHREEGLLFEQRKGKDWGGRVEEGTQVIICCIFLKLKRINMDNK